MNKKLLSLLAMSALPVFAQTNIAHLEVVDNLIVITMKESRNDATCGSHSQTLWALDLTYEQDHALYGLVLTAVAKSKAIEFTGSGVCLGDNAIERVSKVSYKE